MKILIIGDVHFSQYSSILRKRGNTFSKRLENLIQSVNWVEDLADKNKCDMVVYLGDLFDKPFLNNEELTALTDINWSDPPHYFLCGNHEINSRNTAINSANILFLDNSSNVISTPYKLKIDNSLELCFLPYIFEDERKSISEYFDSYSKKRLIFSHNDLKNFQFGRFFSKDGFDIKDIESNCDFYFNGHLHNSSNVTDKIINVGNITGQNFSEDAFIYEHRVIIFDTDTMSFSSIENPYSINFYKIDFTKEDVSTIDFMSLITKQNAVCTAKCFEKDREVVQSWLNDNSIEYRILIQPESKKGDNIQISNESLSVDHIEKFKEYVVANFDVNELVKEELMEICK